MNVPRAFLIRGIPLSYPLAILLPRSTPRILAYKKDLTSPNSSLSMRKALRKSIASILASYSEPLDLDEIASELIEALGDFKRFGAVPLRSIYLCLEDAIRVEGENYQFLKTFHSHYMLRQDAKPYHLREASKARSAELKFHDGELGIVSCLGITN